MSRFVRPSKYRHVYGEKAKVHYENAKISGSAWDTDLITAGGKYLAVNWQVSGGGAFAVLPIFSAFTPPSPAGFPLKLPDILPLARGHTAPVLDTAWSTFDDNIVASAGEDGKICIWKIEDSIFEGWGEDGWTPADLSPQGKLSAGGRKVGQVIFHPTASNVLTSASGDHLVRLWDIEQGQDAATITLKGHTDSIQGISWNYVGNTLVTTCRDKKLRMFDPRAGTDPVRVADGHSGVKGSRVVWLGDRDRIATTGFSKMSDRQLGLWDTSSLSTVSMDSLDSSAGVLMPFFAEGNDVLFLAGKGDGNIRYYELENDALHHLNEYKSSEPQRGMTLLPRRALDIGQNEIARGFKLAGGGIQPMSFIVPRKAESFQSDIFPPAVSDEAALSASDFFGGKNARPKMVDLETRSVSTSSAPISAPPTAQPSKGTETPPVRSSTPATPAKSQSVPSPAAPSMAAFTAQTPAKEPEQLETKAEPEPEVNAKSLEIEQHDDSEDETPIRTPPKAESRAEPEQSGQSGETRRVNAQQAVASSNDDDWLYVKKLSQKAQTPTRPTPNSIGVDLFAPEDVVVPARGKAIVDIQVLLAFPPGTYGRIASKSSLAQTSSVEASSGVLDVDYRESVKVVLYNFSDKEYTVKSGDAVALLVLEKAALAPVKVVQDIIWS